MVGAGPGGLTAAMILAHRGFDVTVYEKEDQVGGRNSEISVEGFRFDVGPTFLMMKFILDEVFELAGRRSTDYLEFGKLDPMYRLSFDDFDVDVSDDPEKIRNEIEKHLHLGQQG